MNKPWPDPLARRKSDNVYCGLLLSFLFAVVASLSTLLLFVKRVSVLDGRPCGHGSQLFSQPRRPYPNKLFFYFNAHLPRGPHQRPVGGLFRASIHILHFHLNDIHHLLLRQLSDLGLVWLLRTGSDICCLFQKKSRRRRLGDKCESLILIDGDYDRQDISGLFLGYSIKLFAEGHDIYAILTKSGTHRWRRVGLTCRNLQFDGCNNFFRHSS